MIATLDEEVSIIDFCISCESTHDTRRESTHSDRISMSATDDREGERECEDTRDDIVMFSRVAVLGEKIFFHRTKNSYTLIV